MDLTELTWTTREGVADQLLAFLQGTPPGPEPEPGREYQETLRARAADLLSIVATDSHWDGLRGLALDPAEEPEVRRQAIQALGDLSDELSGDDLGALLADEALCEDNDPLFGKADLLRLARGAETQVVAAEHLQGLEPADRTKLLNELPLEGIGEWLYRQWLEHDRHVLASETGPESPNRWVIRRTRERPESRRLLQELWRQATGAERAELLDELYDEDQVWSFPDLLTPAEREELVEALALPAEELAAHLGRGGLIQALERILFREDQRLVTAPPREAGVISTEALHRLRPLKHWHEPEVDPWLSGHFMDARLHSQLRFWLFVFLWFRNRSLSASTLATVLRTRDYELARTFLPWVARDPEAGDADLLREAFRPEHPQMLRYYGLCGLDRLGEDSPGWREMLGGLARDESLKVWLSRRALGALARLGDVDARDRLTRFAVEEPDLRVRAEALRLLGEVAPETAHPLMVTALQNRGPEYEPPEVRWPCTPLAEEAALFLAHDPSPTVRTLLLRAYVEAGTRGLQVALRDWITSVVSPSGEEDIEECYRYADWRGLGSWHWPRA